MARIKQEKKQLKKNVDKKNDVENKLKKKNSQKVFSYSFFTIILLLCLIQITVSAILNISKIISYKAKIIQISNTRDAAKDLNEQLKDNIRNFSDVTGLEAIARNNLKMSGEDEVLVIINAKPKEETTEKENVAKIIKIKKHD